MVCGRGNNGGDGLVAARRLHGAGKVVEVLLLGPAEGLKADTAGMLARLPLRPVPVTSTEEVARDRARSLAGADLIIDAIFGTGYTPRPDPSRTQELAASMIAAINAASTPVLSVDLPSGWDADRASGAPETYDAVCRSCAAITVHRPQTGPHVCSVDARPD